MSTRVNVTSTFANVDVNVTSTFSFERFPLSSDHIRPFEFPILQNSAIWISKPPKFGHLNFQAYKIRPLASKDTKFGRLHFQRHNIVYFSSYFFTHTKRDTCYMLSFWQMSQRVVHYTISDFKNCVNKLSSKRERNLSETSKHKVTALAIFILCCGFEPTTIQHGPVILERKKTA